MLNFHRFRPFHLRLKERRASEKGKRIPAIFYGMRVKLYFRLSLLDITIYLWFMAFLSPSRVAEICGLFIIRFLGQLFFQHQAQRGIKNFGETFSLSTYRKAKLGVCLKNILTTFPNSLQLFTCSGNIFFMRSDFFQHSIIRMTLDTWLYIQSKIKIFLAFSLVHLTKQNFFYRFYSRWPFVINISPNTLHMNWIRYFARFLSRSGEGISSISAPVLVIIKTPGAISSKFCFVTKRQQAILRLPFLNILINFEIYFHFF